MASSDGTDYVIGRPGGPAGPFWSIIRASNDPKLNGNVIAMQILNEKDAKLFVEALRSRDKEASGLERVPLDHPPSAESLAAWEKSARGFA